MKALIISIISFLILSNYGFSQCGEETYELTVAKAGKDVVLVRDFKVKLREGNKRNPFPTSRFSVLMQKDLTYRFTISKDKLSTIEPILQLFDRNEMLGSTFDAKTAKHNERFDYQCHRTGNYQVLISLKDAKPGCAIGIMAMVTDSSFFAQGKLKPANDRYILYAGIETPLNIITDQLKVKRAEIKTERGEILKKDSSWFALIPTEGPVNIHLKLFDYTDSIVEEIDQEFNVIVLPKPEIFIEGAEREYINAATLSTMAKLMVTPQVFNIHEFYLSTDLAYHSGLRSDNEFLTYEMIAFIKSLPPQQRFYIKDVQISGPDGSNTTVEMITYHVR